MEYQNVLATGVFDLFHVGHLRYLQQARTQGERLSVAVTPDTMVLAVKGKRPVIPLEQRMEIIHGLGWVDFVGQPLAYYDDADGAAQWIADWDINHVVVGGGWAESPRWARLTPALAQRGISVSFALQTEGISTTLILDAIQRQN
jgi:glycerol-3-phosphate cytidylyltransferase